MVKVCLSGYAPEPIAWTDILATILQTIPIKELKTCDLITRTQFWTNLSQLTYVQFLVISTQSIIPQKLERRIQT